MDAAQATSYDTSNSYAGYNQSTGFKDYQPQQQQQQPQHQQATAPAPAQPRYNAANMAPSQQPQAPAAGGAAGAAAPDASGTGEKGAQADSTAPAPFPPTRRGGRVWFTVVTLAAGLAVAALAAYSLTLVLTLRESARAYSAGDYDRAIERAETFEAWAVLDKHRGPFNSGTARAQKDDLDGAEIDLRRALELTTKTDECVVRQNLALVLEAKALKAREAGNEDDAVRLLDEGITVSQEAPEDCRPPESPQDQSQTEDEERMEKEKDPNSDEDQQQQGGGDEQNQDPNDSSDEQNQDPNDSSDEDQNKGSEGTDDPNDSGADGQQQSGEDEGMSDRERELNKRNEEGQRRLNEDGQGTNGGSNADKPW